MEMRYQAVASIYRNSNGELWFKAIVDGDTEEAVMQKIKNLSEILNATYVVDQLLMAYSKEER